MKMTCPHCKDKSAAFEAEEEIRCRPTIEDWEFSLSAQNHSAQFCCLRCDGLVEIDLRQRFIKKLNRPEPIFDDQVQKIFNEAKEHLDSLIPLPVIPILVEKNYRRISDKMRGGELRSAILEQKP